METHLVSLENNPKKKKNKSKEGTQWLSEAAPIIHLSSVRRRKATDRQAPSASVFDCSPQEICSMQEDHGCCVALNDVTYHMVLFPLCLDIPVPWGVSMLLPRSCALYSLYIRKRASFPFHLDLSLRYITKTLTVFLMDSIWAAFKPQESQFNSFHQLSQASNEPWVSCRQLPPWRGSKWGTVTQTHPQGLT